MNSSAESTNGPLEITLCANAPQASRCTACLASLRFGNASSQALDDCAPASPSIAEALHSQQVKAHVNRVVITVLDEGYSNLLSTFEAMCQRNGLPHTLALYLGDRKRSALRAARSATHTRSSTHRIVHSWGLAAYSSHASVVGLPCEVAGRTRVRCGIFYNIGRTKLLFAAQLAHAGFSPINLELDVLLLRPPLAAIARVEAVTAAQHQNQSLDGWAMFCHINRPAVRYNLGFQVYSVPVTRPVTQLLKSAAVAAFHDARWDQEQFNAEMNVMRLKLGRLEICAHAQRTRMSAPLLTTAGRAARAGEWLAQDHLPELLHELYVAGDVRAIGRRASRDEIGVTAAHLIGTVWYRPKLHWLMSALAYDPAPAQVSGRRGYVYVVMPAHLHQTPLTPAHSLSLRLTLALGTALHRTPVLPIFPNDAPSLCEAARVQQRTAPGLSTSPTSPPALNATACSALYQSLQFVAGAECTALTDLRACEGSFMPAPFLRGHLYLNRSAIPCRAIRASWAKVSSRLEHLAPLHGAAGANGGSDHSGCSERGGHDGADNDNHNGGRDCMEGRRRRSEDDEHVAHLNNGTGVALEAPSHVNAARAEAAPQAHARAHAPPQAAACDPNEDLLVVLLDGLPESVASGALSAANLSALTSSALDELIRPSWSAAAASEWERSLGKAWEAVPEHLRNSSDTCLTKHLPSQSDPLRRFCQSRSSKMLSDAMAWYERWLNTSI